MKCMLLFSLAHNQSQMQDHPSGDGGVSNPKAALQILRQLGLKESTAKKQIVNGKLSLYRYSRNVTDAHVSALARHCPGMTEIVLTRCSNITDTSVTALTRYCPKLTKIALKSCPHITNHAKRILLVKGVEVCTEIVIVVPLAHDQ